MQLKVLIYFELLLFYGRNPFYVSFGFLILLLRKTQKNANMEKIAELIERLFTEALIPAVNKTVSEAIDKAIAERGFSTTTSKYPANLTINQAAELSGLAPRTLYQLNSGKQIPAAFKSGGKLLFRRDEFITWVNNR